MAMRQESERAYIVHVEASAAVGFEIACTAIDAEAAQEHVEALLPALVSHFQLIIDGLMQAGPDAMKGYMQQSRANGDAPELTIARGILAYSPEDVFETIEAREAEE